MERIVLRLIGLCAALGAGGCGFHKVTPACYVYVVTSDTHTCARRTDLTLDCWGGNQSGQLGTGDTDPRSTPTEVLALHGAVKAIYVPTSLGYVSDRTASTCVRKTDNSLWCWGANEYGQLGTGDTRMRLAPEQVAPDVLGQDVHVVQGGAGFTCARKTDNTLWCWGQNDQGQLGAGDTKPRLVPEQVDPAGLGNQVIGFYAGGSHVCAVRADGTLWCWGQNLYGQLGAGDTRPRLAPTQVAPQLFAGDVTVVVAGATHTCAEKANGTLWCWGQNQYGQLGTSDFTNRLEPAAIDFPNLAPGASLVSAGGGHTCAAKTDGTLWCWGQNQYGQLGRETPANANSAVPVQVEPSLLGTKVALVYAGGTHTCARNADSSLWCWGGNQYEQLGIAGIANSPVPVEIAPACP